MHCAYLHKIHVCGPQICIPEIEYYQKVSSHAQIRPQGAEKQLRKVNVVGGGGGGVAIEGKHEHSFLV